MTEISLTSYRDRVSILDLAGKLLDIVAVWRRRARQRYLLSKMTDYQLKDIGISNAVRDYESSKAFWQI